MTVSNGGGRLSSVPIYWSVYKLIISSRVWSPQSLQARKRPGNLRVLWAAPPVGRRSELEECAQQLMSNHSALHLLLLACPLAGGIFYSTIQAWFLPIDDAHELLVRFSKAFSNCCSLVLRQGFSAARLTREGLALS